MNKNIKERIFKWSCKKNIMFNVRYIVKWSIKMVKVVFLPQVLIYYNYELSKINK